MYITRFYRRDGKQNEDYYYPTYEDAFRHLSLFADDDSGLYLAICIVDEDLPERSLCVLPFKEGQPQKILEIKEGFL